MNYLYKGDGLPIYEYLKSTYDGRYADIELNYNTIGDELVAVIVTNNKLLIHEISQKFPLEEVSYAALNMLDIRKPKWVTLRGAEFSE